ncbi:MAG: trigger factor [Planctomycetales bacterium]
MSDDENDLPETDHAEDDMDNEGVGTAIAEEEPPAPARMALVVDISTAGPCKKHVKVTVPRSDIEQSTELIVREFLTTAAVPGFRPGHVPRKLIEKRFRKEVGEQVRQRVLTQSLQQLGEEHELDAINEPNLAVEELELPESGDFTYEFDVEVRPEFDLPNYAGLKVRRPVKNVTDEEVQTALENYLEQFGQLVPVDGPAQGGDFILADLQCSSGDRELSHASNVQIRLRPVLRFTDAEVSDFGTLMNGVTPGETREARTVISIEATQQELRGEPVTIQCKVTDVKRRRLPELNKEFLDQISAPSVEALQQATREMLERQLAFEQREIVRQQVLEQITSATQWELPEALVARQVDNALHRVVLEMQQAGFSDEQIKARENELLQKQISTTRQALKEHFVLDKIATEEKLEVTKEDKEIEIAFMAQQRGESPRKVRARLEKTGLIENLEAQILERKAVDLVLKDAEFVDVPVAPAAANAVEALQLAVCGQIVAPAPAPMA